MHVFQEGRILAAHHENGAVENPLKVALLIEGDEQVLEIGHWYCVDMSDDHDDDAPPVLVVEVRGPGR